MPLVIIVMKFRQNKIFRGIKIMWDIQLFKLSDFDDREAKRSF